MPKRVLDGEAGWNSDKIAACSTPMPATIGVYYFWFYPIADAHGNFELTNSNVILHKIGANLPFLQIDHIHKIVSEFEKNGLLFTWLENGKLYGHWTGSEKPGLLPKPSDRGKYTNVRCTVPKKKLAAYMAKFGAVIHHAQWGEGEGEGEAILSPHKGDVRAHGVGVGVGVGVCIGVGVGVCEGVGVGVGEEPLDFTPSQDTSSASKTPSMNLETAKPQPPEQTYEPGPAPEPKKQEKPYATKRASVPSGAHHSKDPNRYRGLK